MTKDNFTNTYKTLTGHEPFPWQEQLYERFIKHDDGDNIPTIVSIPTGLGKTSVIAVWLIALMNHPEKMPRRLVYVVNRRTVVDQTTAEMERLRKNLRENLSVLKPWFKTLAVSTLRGQHADNHKWSADPSRPAVICGTVDMIGSRLLFGGYRIGFKSRPLHAGFLGQDVLLVHDEAHLEPAFQKLVETIEAEQKREAQLAENLPWPKLRVMALSATTRNHADKKTLPFTLTADDREHSVVKQRIEAAKKLHLHPCEDENKQLVAQMVELALRYKTTNRALLMFARKVEDVEKIAAELTKALKKEKLPENVATLTGTMRGRERDELVQSNGVFARFMPKTDTSQTDTSRDVTPVEGTAYLVCTSAGEVGVNLSADHMVSDLSTFDSMTQRFGRVNRFGDCDDTEIHVVHPNSFGGKGKISEFDLRRQKTLRLLKQLELKGNANSEAIDKLDPSERDAAFAPPPTILPATDILFDAWAMTTIRDKMPGRPPVEPYLHGVAEWEWEPPRTSVAWRDEVKLITGELLKYHSQDLPRELLEDYPLKPHELLSDRTDRVFGKLQKLAVSQEAAPVWLIEGDGNVEITTLGKLIEGEKKHVITHLANCTILLPPSVGGLCKGMLIGNDKAKSADDVTYDVADCWYKGKERVDKEQEQKEQMVQCRVRVWDDEKPPGGMAMIRTIDTKPDADEFDEPAGEDEAEGVRSTRRFWRWYARPRDTENVMHASATPITWDHHTNDVVKRATDIVDALGLPDNLKQAVILAARLHDLGKKRELWQRSIGNPDPGNWHAKSGKPVDGPRWRQRRLSDYRHEFGSLLDVLDSDQSHLVEFNQLDDERKDLVLHLVAASHGYARPHFPLSTTIDPGYTQADADAAAIEVPRRYARLQRKFGRWGLAYLESLLRAADWAASAEPAKKTKEEDQS